MKYIKLYENDLDPYDEEDWDEMDIDLEVTKPGLRVWHVKGNSLDGDGSQGINWNCNIHDYSEYIKEKNPHLVKDIDANPGFYAGFGAGMVVMEQKMKLQNKNI